MGEHGTFIWNELNTQDLDTAKRFYEKTIGWTFDSMPSSEGTYWLAKQGGQSVGGLFDLKAHGMAGVPDHWMSYLAVDDVDKRVELAKAEGASMIREPFDIPGVGRIAILKQPGGGVVGWMKPAPMSA